MDRGEASSQHSNSGTEEIFLAKHNVPFWSAQRDNNQQCQAIRLPHIQEFLPLDGVRSTFRISISPSVQWSSGKSECIDIHSHKKILENQLKGKWAEELLRAVWSYNTSICRAMKFTPFKLLYGEEPVRPEETKLRSARTKMEATYCPSEAESKDLLTRAHESTRKLTILPK
jgi:hypothetical protein